MGQETVRLKRKKVKRNQKERKQNMEKKSHSSKNLFSEWFIMVSYGLLWSIIVGYIF